MTHRLKAFTLPELLTALALVSLVMITGAAVYRVLTQLQRHYQQQVDDTYASARLRHMLAGDVYKAWSLDWQADSLLLLDRWEEPILRYHLSDSLLLRVGVGNQQIDTFAFSGQWGLPVEMGTLTLIDTLRSVSYIFRLPNRSETRRRGRFRW